MSSNVDLSLQQFIDAWRLMCTGDARHVTASDKDLEYIFSGLPIAFFNVAVLTGHELTAADVTSRGHAARAWAADKNAPWLFIVTHERLARGTDAAAALDACALGPMMPLTGMLTTELVPPVRHPEKLSLQVPRDDQRCAAILDVNALAYGMDLEAGKPLLGTHEFWKDQFPVVGLLDAKPVCCAGVMMLDGLRYVALVATDPALQRRGYAEAAMRHALDVSARAHGERPTVLHATAAGRPLYERMGYRPISTHTIFMEKKYLQGA